MFLSELSGTGTLPHLLKTHLETIQSLCMDSMEIPISFLIDQQGTSWEDLALRYEVLKAQSRFRLSPGMVLSLAELLDPGPDVSSINRALTKQYHQLEACLESGQEQAFKTLLREMAAQIFELGDSGRTLVYKWYYDLSLMFLSLIQQNGWTDLLAETLDIHKLLDADAHGDWESAKDFLLKLGDAVVCLSQGMETDKPYAAIQTVKAYIQDHMDGDLSLVRLAEVVHYNPSYLSRLFKQISGETLLSYVTRVRIRKAMELLSGTHRRIHEIAAEAGFESPAYFTQAFKRMNSISPQEYRQAMQTGKES